MNITIKSKIENIKQIQDSFEVFLINHDVDIKIIHKLEIMFDELLSNIIIHGYLKDETQLITIKADIKGNKLIIQIIDDAPEFNPLSNPKPDINTSLEDRKTGNLGILMVKKMMDLITYQRNNKKNYITIEKNLK